MSRKTFKRDSVHVVYKTVRKSAPIGLGSDNMMKNPALKHSLACRDLMLDAKCLLCSKIDGKL